MRIRALSWLRIEARSNGAACGCRSWCGAYLFPGVAELEAHMRWLIGTVFYALGWRVRVVVAVDRQPLGYEVIDAREWRAGEIEVRV